MIEQEYHERQYREIKRSTVLFCDWLESEGLLKDGQVIIDLACGMGANVCYMAKRYPDSVFIGIDSNPDLIDRGNGIISKLGASNCRLEVGDIYNLPIQYQIADGLVSMQTLSWLPTYKNALKEMINLNPKWMAITSLFYNGLVECDIKVREPHWTQYYNIYSLPEFKEFLWFMGYGNISATPFEIDIDIPKPNHKGMETYTRESEGKRLQISGPLLMPWYFISARKDDHAIKEQTDHN
jgi:hypothetical protein